MSGYDCDKYDKIWTINSAHMEKVQGLDVTDSCRKHTHTEQILGQLWLSLDFSQTGTGLEFPTLSWFTSSHSDWQFQLLGLG